LERNLEKDEVLEEYVLLDNDKLGRKEYVHLALEVWV